MRGKQAGADLESAARAAGAASFQPYKSQTCCVPDSLPKQAQQINCKNMVGCNQILNSQLCRCSPAGFSSSRGGQIKFTDCPHLIGLPQKTMLPGAGKKNK